jgi:hypothetical protein
MSVIMPQFLLISAMIWSILHLLPRKYGCIEIQGRSFSIFTLLTWALWIMLTITMGVSGASFWLKDILGWSDTSHAAFLGNAALFSIVLFLLVWLSVLGPSYSNNRLRAFLLKAAILGSSMYFTLLTFAAPLEYSKR